MNCNSISIRQISRLIQARKDSGEKPYLLFLGAGASISSKIPGMYEIVEKFLIDFGVNFTAISSMDNDARYSKFVEIMATLNNNDRYYWLKDLFKDARPSSGYEVLTNLLKKGYFDEIFTPNWDSLLDRSFGILEKLTNLNDWEYYFYVMGVHRDDFIIQSFQQFKVPRIKILKLHGEMASRVIFVTPEEVATFNPDIKDFLKSQLKGRDILMIGYSAADTNIQECIESNRNAIIYVNPKPPGNQASLSFIKKFNNSYCVDGNDGEFDNFMEELSRYI